MVLLPQPLTPISTRVGISATSFRGGVRRDPDA
jgi:hypothetical protein